MLATIAGTAILVYCMAPSLLPKVRGDALPSALFYSNWSFIFRKLSYFQSAGLPSPLTHLWFTSLIMQFYVLWPLLFVLIFQLCRSRVFRKLSYFQSAGLPSPLTHLWFTSLIMQFYVLWPLLFVLIFQLCRSRAARAAVIGALVLASSLEMLLLYTPGQDTSRIYYGLDTRGKTPRASTMGSTRAPPNCSSAPRSPC